MLLFLMKTPFEYDILSNLQLSLNYYKQYHHLFKFRFQIDNHIPNFLGE